jgi:hypothetical protein
MDAGALTRRLALLAVPVALVVGLGACSDDGAAETSATTTTTTDPAAVTSTTELVPVGDPVSRYQLVVGDCFNRYSSIEVFTRVPCEGEHDAEVFHYESHPAPFGDPYPNDREMQKYALMACYAPFYDFAAVLYEVSRLEISAFTPTQENWEDAKARYRGIICYVSDADGAKLVGTMRGRGE